MSTWCVSMEEPCTTSALLLKLLGVIDFSRFCCEGFVVKSSDSADVLSGAVSQAQTVLLLLLSD